MLRIPRTIATMGNIVNQEKGMAYSSNPKSYPQFFNDLMLEIMEGKEKIELVIGKDLKTRNRIKYQYYGFQRALVVEAKRIKEENPDFSQELMRRSERLLRYTVIIEKERDTIVFMNKDVYWGGIIKEVRVSERTVDDIQAMLIDQKYAKVDREIEAQVKGRLQPENTSPFKPHSPDDPNSALNQPITEDDMIALLSGEDSAKINGPNDEE